MHALRAMLIGLCLGPLAAAAQTNVTINWLNCATSIVNVSNSHDGNLRLQNTRTGSVAGEFRLPCAGKWHVLLQAMTDGNCGLRDETVTLTIRGRRVATYTNWPAGFVRHSNAVAITARWGQPLNI